MRARLFPLSWRLLRPVRAYVTRFPEAHGTGTIVRWLVIPFLPPVPHTFQTTLPGGTTVDLRFREVIGLATLLSGSFEKEEIKLAQALAVTGSTIFDVGANVGVFSIPLSRAVGGNGRIVAIEPSHENVTRLREHLERNCVTNVEILEMAAGREPGRCSLYLARDPAFHSTRGRPSRQAPSGVVDVEMTSIDTVWKARGRPPVSLVKIDVEGAELQVLSGMRELLAAEEPTLFVEANTDREAREIAGWLGDLAYKKVEAPGLQRWNHVFRRR